MKGALKIALIYCFFGAFWIMFSDKVVLWIIDPSQQQEITYFQTIKGLVYVFLTGILLYFLVLKFYKALDEELKEQERLNHQLMLKSKELENANKDLEGFVYKASKDLLEPLRMITNFLNLFRNKYVETLDDKGKSYIEFAHEGAINMRSTLFDFLDYSTTNINSSDIKEVDLNDVLKVIQDKLRRKIDEKKVTIYLESLPTVVGSREGFIRIFLNLIDNAIKYSKPGIQPKIQIGYVKLGDFYKFYVKDNGLGISDEFKEEVFQVFRKLNSNSKYSGSGMGLPIVKKIVEDKGGKCWLESSLGDGSTFYFTIPI